MTGSDSQLVAAVAEAVVARLDPRIERIEQAIIGDEEIGHVGLAERVISLETLAKTVDQSHAQIEERRLDGDRRLHERMDKLEAQWARVTWVAIGVGLGSGAGGVWLAKAFGA